MTEPSANRVDVNTPAKEMSCAGVSNGMGADAFGCHRGNLFRNSRGIALDHGMDTEAGQRLAKTIEKDSLGRMAAFNEHLQPPCRVRPKWAVTKLITFSSNSNGGIVTVRIGQLQIANQKLCGFIGSGAGVIQEQQEDMISLSLSRALIGSVQQRIHLQFFKVGNRLRTCFLEGYAANLSRPADVFWAMKADKPDKCVNGCQTLIACRDAATSRFLQISKE